MSLDISIYRDISKKNEKLNETLRELKVLSRLIGNSEETNSNDDYIGELVEKAINNLEEAIENLDQVSE
jgi:chorismate mutase